MFVVNTTLMSRVRFEDAEQWSRRVARIISGEDAVGVATFTTSPLRWFDDMAPIIFSDVTLKTAARRARRKQGRPISTTTRTKAHHIVARVITILFGGVYTYAAVKTAEARSENVSAPDSARAHRRPVAN